MPDDAITAIAADALVASVQRQVTELADGNPFFKEGFAFESSRVDRTVVLTMRVDVSQKPASETLHGKVEPAGSTRCGDTPASATFLDSAFHKAATAPDTLDRIKTLLRTRPAQAFAETRDDFDIGVVAGRCRVHEPCGTCARTGVVNCGSCGGHGDMRCRGCSDGKRGCSRCNSGQVQYTERVWDYASKSYSDQSRWKNCPNCGGTGRAGTCMLCNGTMKEVCNGCDGRGTVGCGTCGRTGWLTRATTLRLVGEPDRQLALLPLCLWSSDRVWQPCRLRSCLSGMAR